MGEKNRSENTAGECSRERVMAPAASFEHTWPVRRLVTTPSDTARFPYRYNERMPGSDEMKPAGVKLTYDDFLLFPDDGMRHELIDGEHYVTPSPNTKHQTVSMDPEIDVVRIYRRSGERFTRPVELSRETNDVLTESLLPGLELPLARLFRV